ncbi:MAG TPA: LamG domain-containing protein, partial [Verrucomicrobiota bacterium]|nr:LamG domain-containing protein [Verrucomicrobiota bacterium]
MYLPFDGTYADASGNNRNATPVGSPTIDSAAKVGTGALRVSSLRSSSSFNFATLGTNDQVPFGETNDFTVAFWVKVDRLTGDPSFVANKAWSSGNNTGWTIGSQTDGRIEWNYRRTGVDGLTRKDLDLIQRGNLLNNGQWNHVVVVWNINGDAVTYYNGERVSVVPIAPGTGTLIDPALSLNLGQDGTGAYGSGDWDGLFDDVAIWDRSLSDDEVLTLYGFGLFGDSILAGPITDALGAHLKFDGSTADASGTGNNGTVVGTVTYEPGRIGQAARLLTRRDQGVFNYVTLGANPPAQFGESTNFTVAFWAKLNDWTSDPAFLGNKNWGAGGNIGWVVATDGDGRIQWNYRRSGGP